MMNNNLNIYNSPKALYIHIPFCKEICPYCDFHKMVASRDLKEKYIETLIREFELKKLDNYSFETLYFGGGTPSSLDLDLLEKLFISLNNKLNLEKFKEITFECNVKDLNINLLNLLKKYYINRLSIGIQTFNHTYQNMLKRISSYDDVLDKIKMINEIGFNNYSIDLMYGFVNQTIKELKEDLDKVLSLNPKHISLYCLTIENHSIFGFNTINKNSCYIGSEEDQNNEYYYIVNYLNSLGYHHYEISNFSKEGFESIHNLTYWNSLPYECLGSGASSFNNLIHYETTSKIHSYIESINNNLLPDRLIDELDMNDLIDEYIIMNLRKIDGFSIIDFKTRFGAEFSSIFDLNSLINKKLLLVDNNVKINPIYLFVSNYVIVEVLNSRKGIK